MELPECPPVENQIWFEAALDPCMDDACTDIVDDGFMPEGFEVGGELYADHTFACEVHDGSQLGMGSWILNNCTGEGAPASGAARLNFLGEQSLGLPLALGEQVHIKFHGGTHYNNEHRSWSISRPDNTIVAIVSKGIWLPPAELTAPFDLRGSPQPCGTGPTCGGYTGDAVLTVTLNLKSEKVPSGAMTVLQTTPEYTILVPNASYGGPFGCGIFGWVEYYMLAIVLAP